MQFLLLLLTNVFIGAVLYLVISLKLEKQSSEYREKKFRKEMDEIIREFNSAADRNISLLENKIELLKKLLERSGQLKSVDFTVGELNKLNETREVAEIQSNTKSEDKNIVKSNEFVHIDRIDQNNNFNPGHNLKKSLLIFFNKIILFFSGSNGLNENLEVDSIPTLENNNLIEIKYEKLKSNESKNEVNEQKNNELTEEEIFDIIASSKDKNLIVTRLFDNGCSVENISKYSGIPVGEIKLVLNLNNAR